MVCSELLNGFIKRFICQWKKWNSTLILIHKDIEQEKGFTFWEKNFDRNG